MTFVSYPMNTARIRKRGRWPFTEPFLECTVPGCGWASPWPLNDTWRLDQVVEAAAGHPCRGDNPPPSAIHPTVTDWTEVDT